ncbi:MAG TPA: EF-hand domain-containing protein [Gammaproteobacteria bacterium]
MVGTALALVHCTEPQPPPAEQRAESRGPDRVIPPGTSGTPSFAALDADGDGYVTAEEARRAPELREVFSRADADQDRRLGPQEFSQATREVVAAPAHTQRVPLFPSLDRDENGRISPDEAQAFPALAERFAEVDGDGSGGIDVHEYSDAVDQGVVR